MAETTTEVAENKAKKKPEEAVHTNSKKEMKLTDLKVADLRSELENRGLDKTGVKAALVERLRKAIEEEGEDPDEYLFEAPLDGVTPTKKSKRIKEVLNESKHDSDLENEEEEIEDPEEKQNEEPIDASENGEVLQLSIDDKEINLEGKDLEKGSSDNEDDEVKVEAVRSSGKGIKNTEAIVDAKESEPVQSEVVKTPVKVVKEVASEPKPQEGAKDSEKQAKDEKAKTASPDKNVWVTGLASSTRAADLKTLFSKQGKVVSVKIVTNARQVSGEKKFYGFIRMSTNKDALKAVQQLHKTELNGQVISLEVTKDQPGTLLKKMIKAVPKKAKVDSAKTATSAQKGKKETETKDGKATDDHDKDIKDDRRRRDPDRDHRPRDSREYRDYNRGSFRRPYGFRGRMRGRGSYSNFRDRGPPEPSFRRPYGRGSFFNSRRGFRSSSMRPMSYNQKVREERISRDRFREIRETERRRAQEDFRYKMVERKQREEAYRLEREKVQLRIEREILERERAEILKIEREKQRVERERLEREKEKLRRQTQMRDTNKRPYPRSPEASNVVWEKDKRVRYDSRYPPKPFAPFSTKPPIQERPEPPSDYSRHKFEPRPGSSSQYDRDGPLPQSSRSDFSKYSRDKPPGPPSRDHDERRVCNKRGYFKDDSGGGGGGGRSNYPPPRDVDRYPPPQDDRGFKRKVHDTGPRPPRGGGRGGGRRMPYY